MYEPPKRKLGRRHEFELTQELVDQAELLSGRGLTYLQIADYMGITERYLYKLCNQHEGLKKALKSGKAKAISLVSGKLIEQIKHGDVKAMIFYLRTQAGWRDVSTVVVEGFSDHNEDELKMKTSDPNEASKIYQQIMLKGRK